MWSVRRLTRETGNDSPAAEEVVAAVVRALLVEVVVVEDALAVVVGLARLCIPLLAGWMCLVSYSPCSSVKGRELLNARRDFPESSRRVCESERELAGGRVVSCFVVARVRIRSVDEDL